MFATLCMLVGFAAGALLDKIIFCLIVWFLIQKAGHAVRHTAKAVRNEAAATWFRAKAEASAFRHRWRHVIGPAVVIRPWG